MTLHFLHLAALAGVRLTAAQRVLAEVAFDCAEPASLSSPDRLIAAELFGEIETVPSSARGVLAAVCGARGGKSYVMSALYSVWRMVTADLDGLAPGEQASAVVVAPDVRLGRQVLRYAAGAIRQVKPLASCIISESTDGLVLRRPDGHLVALEVLPATRGGSAVRGRSLVSAVLDEAAFFRDADSVVNDEEVFRGVAPRVLPGGMVVLASTPWAEAGLLFELFSANHGRPTTALAVHAPTSLLRAGDARIAAMIRRERQRDPDNARREFDAEFVTVGSGLFFPPAVLERATSLAVPRSDTCPRGTTAYIGGDLGLVRDSTAFAVAHEVDGQVSIVDLLELRPSPGVPLRLSEVVAAGCALAARHGAREIHVDHHALEPAREHLPEGYTLSPVAAGAPAKTERHQQARSAMAEGRVHIAAELGRIVRQLGTLTARPLPGGGYTITTPRRSGAHGDAAAAAVLAIEAALARAGGELFARGQREASMGANYLYSGRWDSMPGRGF